MIRTGMKDIARAAGVSVSTVDRVLNGRGKVRQKTREKIEIAARNLGFPTTALQSGGGARRHFRFLVPGGTNSFLAMLSKAIEERGQALAAEGIETSLVRVDNFDVTSLCRELQHSDDIHAFAAIVLDHPLVREAIRELSKRNVPVVSLVSDIANSDRAAYVGVDNRAAGRLAGHLMCLHLKGRTTGKVALFRGSPSYRGHEERENGFRAKLAEMAPGLSIVLAPDTHDGISASHQAMADLLAAHDDLCGIYNVAGGNRGIAKGLEDAKRSQEIIFIAHELSVFSRNLMLAGVIDALIAQDPVSEADTAFRMLDLATRDAPFPPSSPVPLQIYFAENLP